MGRSFCENCKKDLKWGELIPIFSFIFLRGKCSSCKKKVGLFNFVSELLLALFFLFFYLLGAPVQIFVFLIILYFFAVYDFHYRSIPKNITDVVLILSFFYWLFLLILDYSFDLVYPILVLTLLSIMILLFSRKKSLFGLGDILVLLILAFWFEAELFFPVLFLSFVLGGIFSLFLVIRDRSYLKKYIPFIPFIFLGFVFACLSYYSSFITFDYIFLMW